MSQIRMRTLRVIDIDYVIRREEQLGRFHLPFAELYPPEPRRFRGATDVVEFCLAWVWYQWLKGGEQATIDVTTREVITKSIRLQAEDVDRDWRAEHDVFCAHLTAIAGNREQRSKLAEQLIWAEGKPAEDLCQQAWSGFMKFALSGDKRRARSQAEIMFGAPKPINLRLPRKPLVRAWLDENWPAFNRALEQSYSKMWASAYKNGKLFGFLNVQSEDHIEIALKRRNARVDEHWQENALAILAWEKGVQAPTDPLWFPNAALKRS